MKSQLADLEAKVNEHLRKIGDNCICVDVQRSGMEMLIMVVSEEGNKQSIRDGGAKYY